VFCCSFVFPLRFSRFVLRPPLRLTPLVFLEFRFLHFFPVPPPARRPFPPFFLVLRIAPFSLPYLPSFPAFLLGRSSSLFPSAGVLCMLESYFANRAVIIGFLKSFFPHFTRLLQPVLSTILFVHGLLPATAHDDASSILLLFHVPFLDGVTNWHIFLLLFPFLLPLRHPHLPFFLYTHSRKIHSPYNDVARPFGRKAVLPTPTGRPRRWPLFTFWPASPLFPFFSSRGPFHLPSTGLLSDGLHP